MRIVITSWSVLVFYFFCPVSLAEENPYLKEIGFSGGINLQSSGVGFGGGQLVSFDVGGSPKTSVIKLNLSSNLSAGAVYRLSPGITGITTMKLHVRFDGRSAANGAIQSQTVNLLNLSVTSSCRMRFSSYIRCSGGRRYSNDEFTITPKTMLSEFPLDELDKVTVYLTGFSYSLIGGSAPGGSMGAYGTAECLGCNGDEKIALVYVNGVLTEDYSALEQAQQLELHLPAAERENVDVYFYYNETESYVDFIEAVTQKIRLERETRVETVDIARSLSSLALASGIEGLTTTVTSVFVDFVAKSANISSAKGFTNAVEELLIEYDRVVLAGYSQGNLFINEVMEDIDASLIDRVEIAAIATPASYVSGRFGAGTHITERFDIIQHTPRALGTTHENTPRCNPLALGLGTCLLGHSLIDIYLADNSNTESAIQSTLESAVGN